jgi:hypothetical protein
LGGEDGGGGGGDDDAKQRNQQQQQQPAQIIEEWPTKCVSFVSKIEVDKFIFK